MPNIRLLALILTDISNFLPEGVRSKGVNKSGSKQREHYVKLCICWKGKGRAKYIPGMSQKYQKDNSFRTGDIPIFQENISSRTGDVPTFV